MKKLVLTVTASLACLAAFAQGKISFQNDSTRLAYYGSTAGGADSALQGQGVGSALMPAGITLVADLYMGTSSTALTLYSTTTFSAVPGKWNSTSVLASSPFIAAGASVFVVTQIRDQSIAAPATFTGTRFGAYYGTSDVFTFTLGGAPTYPAMWSGTSTWAPGTFNMDQYGVGSRGAIAVTAVPEPASFALAGLGIAAMAILRRRK